MPADRTGLQCGGQCSFLGLVGVEDEQIPSTSLWGNWFTSIQSLVQISIHVGDLSLANSCNLVRHLSLPWKGYRVKVLRFCNLIGAGLIHYWCWRNKVIINSSQSIYPSIYIYIYIFIFIFCEQFPSSFDLNWKIFYALSLQAFALNWEIFYVEHMW